ncbi:hypothetical protein ACEWK1_14050 [Metabacillus sp. YM-086]|uniref:hypothetical protein n=1 Tax=Metabacillus sp. YM-086 TaxID=3341729 RepID=UPI003A864E24
MFSHVGEDKQYFDLSEVNIRQFNPIERKGYLLIRYGEKILLADLQHFINELIDERSKAPYDRYASNKE